ncbi:NAD(+)/NADH kinase [Peptococcus simiae]|uniref:NAD(+)/NADH kinase n=1 Tax=Peptococcus simiae TaxID=1643805 RepID=UPI00397F3DD0
MSITSVGLYANFEREGVEDLCDEIIAELVQRNVRVYATTDSAFTNIDVELLPRRSLLKTIELMLVIGGDGTFLRAATDLAGAPIPMLGINKGHLGFLSELEVEDFFPMLDRILAGEFSIEYRMKIAATLIRDGEIIAEIIGLNDVVINRNPLDNTIALDVYMGEALVDHYRGDGLIVATPTGSTGYSFSAGGPLIYPGTDCLIVNPICAHLMGVRSIIIPADESVDVFLGRGRSGAYLVADGVNPMLMQLGDHLHVERAPSTVQLVHLRDHPFFQAVHTKMLNTSERRSRDYYE